MAKVKEWKNKMYGGQLIAAGDLIQLMDKGELLSCQVLSCLAVAGGGCFAKVVVAEGPRKGEKIEAMLRPGSDPSAEETHPSDRD
jgi:hypothetical protein